MTLPNTLKGFKNLNSFLLYKLKQVNPSFDNEELLNGVIVEKVNNTTLKLDWSNSLIRHINPVNEITINELDLTELLATEGFTDNTLTLTQKDEILTKLPRELKTLWIENKNAIHVELDANLMYKPFTFNLSNNENKTDKLLKNTTTTIRLKTTEERIVAGSRIVHNNDLSVPTYVNNNQKQNTYGVRITPEGNIIGEDTGSRDGYKFLIFPENIKGVQFKLARTLSWLTFSLFDESNNSYLYSIGLNHNSTLTGRIVRWRRGGFGVMSASPSNDEIIEKPFNKNLPLGTIVRAMINDSKDVLDIYLTRPNEEEVHWLSIKRNNGRFRTQNTTHKFNRLGIVCGVSPAETADDGTKTLYHREVRMITGRDERVVEEIPNTNTIEKYAILVTGGQSNMVGYDESLIDLNDYPEDDRLKQWGIYDGNKNQIIPLGPHAHAYQDMRPFSNPNNPQPNLGTKGIHYPLAKLLKEQLKQIPSDYKILVINGSFGSTWFGSNDGVGGLDSTGYLPRSLTSKARWGVNSSYYLSIKKRIQKIFEDHPASKLIGFVWCQGEHENVRNFDGYTAMRNDYISYVSSLPLERRFIRDPQKNVFFMDSCSKWKKIPEYNRYMDMIKQRVHNNDTFVEIPIETDTNLVNGTGRTTSDREAHFGNDAYKNVIAPLVFKKIKNVIDNQ